MAHALTSGGWNASLGVCFGIVVFSERGLTEAYKIFVRDEPQGKYSYSSSLHILGRPVESWYLRLGFGMFIVAIGSGFMLSPTWARVSVSGAIPGGLVWGLAGGLAIAWCGAWKDAPSEGFSAWAFPRSPVVTTAWAVLAMRVFSSDPQLVLIFSMGAERMTVELCKSFVWGRRPSKFRNGIVPSEEMIVFRRRLVLPYILTWGVFLLLLVGGRVLPSRQFSLALALASCFFLAVAANWSVRTQFWKRWGATWWRNYADQAVRNNDVGEAEA